MRVVHTDPVPDLAAAVRTRRVGARELVAAALAAVERHDAVLNAVVHLDPDGALAAAEAVDRQAVDDPAGLAPLAGVPTLVKDLNNVRGMPTTFGTRAMTTFRAPFDDESVRRMRAAGMVVLGKTNVPEVGSTPVTESLLHGPARNPWDPSRTAGGSSGGAAAAVAAGYVPVAHASDGGGSIRIPASCCGVVGLKPSRGRVSNAPLFGDQVMGWATQGPIGRRVVDVAALLDVVHGYAPGDPYHLPPPDRPYVDEVGADPGRLRVGVVAEVPWATPSAPVTAAVEGAVALLERHGHAVDVLDLRLPGGVIDQFVDVWSASVAANPLPVDGYEPLNQAFAARGAALSAPALLRTATSLQVTARAVVAACAAVDVVLAPVLTEPPLPVGALDGLELDRVLDLTARYLGITPIVNVTGQPAITVPTHRSPGGLPVGVQLIGGAGGEAGLIRLAAQLEAAVDLPAPDPTAWEVPA